MTLQEFNTHPSANRAVGAEGKHSPQRGDLGRVGAAGEAAGVSGVGGLAAVPGDVPEGEGGAS